MPAGRAIERIAVQLSVAGCSGISPYLSLLILGGSAGNAEQLEESPASLVALLTNNAMVTLLSILFVLTLVADLVLPFEVKLSARLPVKVGAALCWLSPKLLAFRLIAVALAAFIGVSTTFDAEYQALFTYDENDEQQEERALDGNDEEASGAALVIFDLLIIAIGVLIALLVHALTCFVRNSILDEGWWRRSVVVVCEHASCVLAIIPVLFIEDVALLTELAFLFLAVLGVQKIMDKDERRKMEDGWRLWGGEDKEKEKEGVKGVDEQGDGYVEMKTPATAESV